MSATVKRWRASLLQPSGLILGLITLLGLCIRLYFIERWRPALVGFPDTNIYIGDALNGVFNNPLRVGGYSEFLRLLHGIRPHLSFVIFVQHMLGLASGLLLFAALRRARLPYVVALVPAIVVMLNGSEIFIEHAPLTEALFIFLVDLALYSIVRCWFGSWRWSLVAGLALGLAVDVRSIGLLLLITLAVASLLAPSTNWRRRLLVGALILVAAVLPIGGYLKAHKSSQGYGGFTGAGYFDLYARVAPFANCAKFKPPSGTAKLCIDLPRNQRPGHDVWEFTAISPAVKAFGEPDVTVPRPNENSQLRSFATAAILGQPWTYAKYVARDLVRLIDPSFSSSPYTGIAATGYGNTPGSLADYYFNTSGLIYLQPVLAAYYPGDGEVHHTVGFLRDYERVTRIDGVVMAILLILALTAPIVTKEIERRVALLFLAATALLLVGPILVSEYDYRFTIPAFGTLAATAAIGGLGMCRYIGSRGQRS